MDETTTTRELVRVDLSQFGLEESKAAAVKADFDAVLKIAVELEDEYNELVAQEVTPELAAQAKALRLKYVKVRTGIAAVHKERKAFYLSGGRAVDGLKNAYTHAVEGNENRLKEIETHFERIEAERIAKLHSDRADALQEFEPDYIPENLGTMEHAVWENYLNGVELSYKQRKEAERKAEEERIAKEKAEAEERERVRKENERLKAEAEERDRREAAERAEREKAEKERIAKEEAERKRIEAECEKERREAEAKLAAERAERERIQAEQRAKEEAERKEREAAEARAKDIENKKKVMWDAATCLEELGLDESDAHAVVEWIADGKVKNISINY